ncbi:purine-binding chemotaxis protein CheW [Nodosilinea sp. LEGE 07088]|uniref:chemotaxis protein CheW n=1 Tax=Nodosilinea sp. LEGE 07088 TaxID=2777968 RepID=UPI00187EBEB1|nr:chemotaxis protein CheW [Nodosilinea sp. LEGE 07088]MBE9140887.1 purine-binding chemotaxis protein CheW [Nodosilinea sp. LEGE 07088]
MQQNSSYLTFSLGNYLYGINSDYFEEVIPLPELILLPEVDDGIVGIFDLRGEILPVLDLNYKLGYPKTDYRLSDSLIIIKCFQIKIGIIINGFSDIREISSHEIVNSDPTQMNSDLEDLTTDRSAIIAGVVTREDEVWVLSGLENWLSEAQITAFLGSLTQQEEGENIDLPLDELIKTEENEIIFCPTSTDEERAIFRSRAESLKASAQIQELTDLQSFVVFYLGDHLWGIDSGIVREFVDIKKIIPVPCCPKHIIGNANLRGEILTIVDLRVFLNIPVLEILSSCKVIVVEFEEMVMGVRVDSIRDATFLINPKSILSTATALPNLENDYLQGAVPYEEDDQQLVGILNLPSLLFKGGFVVDELV